MLNPDRAKFVTGSIAWRVMAGFETELAGRNMVEPEGFRHLADYMEKNGKPLVGDLEKAGILTTGKKINECWAYYQATKPVFSEGMESVAREIAMGDFITERENYVSDDMENGNQYEGEAVQKLIEKTGIYFSNTGDDQLFFSKGNLGVTPDGVYYDGFDISACAEVKCPKDTTHMKYLVGAKMGLSLLQIEPKYYWQAQTGLYVTGAKVYHWESYHPNFIGPFNLVYCRVEPNQEHINLLISRAEKVIERAAQIKDTILRNV